MSADGEGTGGAADVEAEIRRLLADLDPALAAARSPDEVRAAVSRLTGRKGAITALLKLLPSVAPDRRPRIGAAINAAKDEIARRGDARLAQIDRDELRRAATERPVDVSLPPRGPRVGHAHPLSSTMQDAVDVFAGLGFEVADGPEVEDDFHNFGALGFPPDHPARDMQDTFFLEGDDLLLRTHTSPVQIREMLSRPPPIRIVCPGAVYRHDDDPTHSPRFFQIEGLLVDERATFADLKGLLALFVREFFGPEFPVRFRPSFFPFTEPSAEVDCGCVACRGAGCRVCKGTGWLEILGCGMVDPKVFRNVGYDPEQWQGFAFGMGVDRLAMLRHGIRDIRLLYENDVRFLARF